MKLCDGLLPEFDHEMAVTRRLLERAPDASFGWRPHEKSWTLGGLCTHISQLPYWGLAILNRDGYDLVRDTGGAKPVEKTAAVDVLATHDGFIKEVRQRLVNALDAELMTPWSLSRDGHVLMSMPRLSAFKSFVINHTIHHRGQLSVYLRLQNVPLPPIYGPTADESF